MSRLKSSSSTNVGADVGTLVGTKVEVSTTTGVAVVPENVGLDVGSLGILTTTGEDVGAIVTTTPASDEVVGDAVARILSVAQY